MKSEKSTVTVCTETGEVLAPSLTPQEKALGFRRFIQVNCEYSTFLSNLAIEHPKAFAILLFLEDNANTFNTLSITYGTLCEKFKISTTTVWRQLNILKKEKLIYFKKEKGHNMYIINPDVMWKGTPSKRILCEFPKNLFIDKNKKDKKGKKDKKDKKLPYIGAVL